MFIERKAPDILEALANAPLYQKKGTVTARCAAGDEHVTTALADGSIETANVAYGGDWIVTNPGGEEYVIDAETFDARYDATDVPNVFQSRGFCRAFRNPHDCPIEIMASWGETQIGGADCMIADTCGSDGDEMGREPYLIDADSFRETYVCVSTED